MKTYEQKARKHLEKAYRTIDGIAPTPYRQALDALLTTACNIMSKFDKEKYFIDDDYMDEWITYNNRLNSILQYEDIPK